MELYLAHEDLWGCVFPGSSESDKPDTKKDQKARAKICLMVQPHCLIHVRSSKTAREAWDNLKRAYEDKGLTRRLGLLRRLFGVRLEGYRSMEEYVTEVMSLAQQLADISSPIDDEFVGVIMLSGLPLEFDPMVMALESSGAEITSEFVKGKLLQEDVKRSVGDQRHHSDAAFLSSDKSRFHSKVGCNSYVNKPKNRPIFKCFNCNEPGHMSRDCPKRGNKDKVRNDWSLLTALSTVEGRCDWYVDSGATNHMTNCKDWLENYHDVASKDVTCANNEKLCGVGVGNVRVRIGNEGLKTINDVTYVPDLTTNLLSVSAMVKKGMVVTFSATGCQIYQENDCRIEGNVKVTASEIGGIYRLNVMSDKANFVSEKQTQALWHRRLGHLGERNMNLLRSGMATGVVFDDGVVEPCVSCLKGKQLRKPFSTNGARRATNKLGLIHSDLCGPMEEASHSGARYLLTFIDDATRKTFGYFLKSKSEVACKFKDFKVLVENETGEKVKVLRSDNGREYVNHTLQDYLSANGIRHQLTVEYTPEQNGVAERANRTIIEKARSMLQDSDLGKQYWAEAVNTAIYLKNRSPTLALKDVTPEEAWTGEKVDLSHLRVFGCTAHVHIPKQQRKKWDAVSQEKIFVGYCEDTKGYRFIDPKNPRRICKARDVTFIEEANIKPSKNETRRENSCEGEPSVPVGTPVEIQCETTEQLNDSISEDFLGFSQPEAPTDTDIHSGETVQHPRSGNEFSDQQEPTLLLEEVERRYPTRERHAKKFSGMITYHTTCNISEPTSVHEALSSDLKLEWQSAMNEEYNSLLENKAWILVDYPQNKMVVKNKWVFKAKRAADGSISRYKARLVAKGFTQEHGIDYGETFSPVVRNSTIRMLLALAAEMDWDIDHLDVTTAFLNGDLEEEVYMEQPEGFAVEGHESKVCLLKKAIYGLKQSSRVWNKKLHAALVEIGYKRSEHEPCVYSKVSEKGIVIVAVYVDDFVIFSSDETEKGKLKDEVMSRFKSSDLGEASNCLGMRIRRDRNKGEVYVDQQKYTTEILEKFSMMDCNSVSTPLDVNHQLGKVSEVNKEDDFSHLPYQRLIGSLMYLAVCTRPDIAHAVSVLSQFNAKYTEEHWRSAKRVLRYLKGTVSHGLVFKKTGKYVQGFVDADWANDEQDRRSYTGFTFLLGGAAVSWESKKQRTVALSSTEAEYMALAEAAKEAIYVKGLLNELLGKDLHIELFCDNQGAQKLACNPVFHNRTKHIDVRHHFIREAVENHMLKLSHVPTEKMVADVLTKGVTSAKHCVCVEGLGVKSIN